PGRTRELRAELAGRSLAIEIRDIARLRVASNGLQLAVTRDQEPADATVSGGPLGVLALAADSPEPVLARGGVAIGGDAELAQKFRELARLLKPDLEEELSLLVGDVPAHQLGRLARLALGFGRRTMSTTLRNAAEYLAHEPADLVARIDCEHFLRGVDELLDGVGPLTYSLVPRARRLDCPLPGSAVR